MKRHLPLLLALALALGVLAVFLPAADFGYFAMDDYLYTFENPAVQGGLGAYTRAFTGKTESHWIPVTTLSYQLEVSLAGMDPRVFHRTSIALHALAMAGLFLVLRWITGATWPSFLAAALVAVHPLRVESVAWITARKDVLSMFFAVLAFASWVRWLRTRRLRWHLLGGSALALGLLAKPTLVVFPALLLVLDLWPLGRMPRGAEGEARLRASGRLLLEKVPLAVLCAVSALVTYVAQERSLSRLPWDVRLERAFSAPFIYLKETVWPADLTIRFDYGPIEGHPAVLLGAALGAAALTLLAFRERARRPFLAAGWLWYLAALLPVSGIIPAGAQWVSDRFTYLPHVGLALGLAGAWPRIPRRTATRLFSVAAASLLLLGSCLLTRRQVDLWRDDVAFFRRSVALNPTDTGALNLLGAALARGGDLEAAIPLFRESIRRRPGHPVAPFNLGLALARTGRADEAIRVFSDVVQRDPDDIEARMRLVDLFLGQGRMDEAAAQYRAALAITPADWGMRIALGEVLFRSGRSAEAAAEFARVASAVPGTAEEAFARGRQLEIAGRRAEAEALYRRALTLPEGNRGFRATLEKEFAAAGL